MGTTEDRLGIERLISLYARGRDNTEPARYREAFAPDAQIAAGSGKVLSEDLGQILAKVEDDKVRFNPAYVEGEVHWAKMRHIVSNILIELDGDQASASYYVQTLGYNEARRRPELMSVTINEDAYERRSGRWWIVRSVLHFGWEGEEMGKALQVGPWTPLEYRR